MNQIFQVLTIKDKCMKKLFAFTVTATLLLFMTTSIYAQEWSKEQSNVWKTVEDSWAKWKAGDIDGLATMIHDQYQGWNADIPLPISKKDVISGYKAEMEKEKIEFFSINPARIVVTKNAAVVDYYFQFNILSTVNEKQERSVMSGKNVEFYVQENGKWLLLGDLTVLNKNKKDEDK
jgi:hypothetical protein